MKMSEIQNLNQDELSEKLSQMKKTLMQYRFQAKTGKLERRSAMTETKRDIARILTVMNQQKKEQKEKKAKP